VASCSRAEQDLVGHADDHGFGTLSAVEGRRRRVAHPAPVDVGAQHADEPAVCAVHRHRHVHEAQGLAAARLQMLFEQQSAVHVAHEGGLACAVEPGTPRNVLAFQQATRSGEHLAFGIRIADPGVAGGSLAQCVEPLADDGRLHVQAFVGQCADLEFDILTPLAQAALEPLGGALRAARQAFADLALQLARGRFLCDPGEHGGRGHRQHDGEDREVSA
jgi:hypothetical protein